MKLKGCAWLKLGIKITSAGLFLTGTGYVGNGVMLYMKVQCNQLGDHSFKHER